MLACALGLASGPAAGAEPGNKGEEPGIKIGEQGRLHPYLTLDGNYQSFAAVDPVTNEIVCRRVCRR